MIWYAHYLADYDRDTADLTMLEHGAYRLLLDHHYRSGKALDANASVLHRVCRAFADAERQAIDKMLARYFVLGQSGWEHKRVLLELEKAASLSTKRQNSANRRWGKQPHSHASADAIALQEDMQTPCYSQSQSHTHKELPTTDNTFRGDEGFEELTAIYAKREKGHAAQTAYKDTIGEICKDQNIQPADAHKWLMERTRLYVQRTEPRFQKGLTDYLSKHVYAQDESAWGAKGGMNGHSPPEINDCFDEICRARGEDPAQVRASMQAKSADSAKRGGLKPVGSK